MSESSNIEKNLKQWMEISTRRSIHDFVLYAREKGFSLSQLSMLFHIRFRGACGVSDVAQDFGITRAAASQMLERLVQQDLVTRTEASHDRRVKQIVLTEKALRMQKECIAARQKWIDELVNKLSPEEKKQAVVVLHTLIERAKQLKNQPHRQERSESNHDTPC